MTGARGAVVAGIVTAVFLSACGGGSSKVTASASTTSTTAATSTTSTSTSRTFACTPNAEDCTPEQVIETVAQLYEAAGATRAEAECLAPITGTGSHAVNEAFDVPTEAQTEAAIKCAGSEERLRVLATALADYFKEHSTG